MVFTTDGKVEIAKWLGGESATAPTDIGYGDGTTGAVSSDSALESELGRSTISTTDRTGQEVLFEIVIPSTSENGNTISEVGLLNASSDGTLITRDTFAGIAKTANFDIQVDIIVRLV